MVDHEDTHLIIKMKISWILDLECQSDFNTVFDVNELLVNKNTSDSFVLTWNKHLGMIHLLDQETPEYIKIRGDQGIT